MDRRDDERAARLKAALRDNLRRRKAQARGRAEEEAGGSEEETAGRARAPERGPARDADGD